MVIIKCKQMFARIQWTTNPQVSVFTERFTCVRLLL